MKREHARQILLRAALVVLTAQLKVYLFESDLIVSVAVVLLPLYAITWGEFPALPTAAAAALGTFAARVALHWLYTGALDGGGYWPEMVFYLLYGLMFSRYFRHLRWSVDHWRQLLPLALIDYASNLGELLCRGSGVSDLQMHLGLIVVALLRTLLVMGFWSMLKSQNLLLLKREHAQRYRELMLLFSRLRGEMVWMEKSAAMMENVMGSAYQLYARLQQEGSPASAQALAVSKDIHEIKKEYQLILRGLTEALREEDEGDVSFQELWRSLYENMRLSARHAGVQVEWETDLQLEFKTDKHFQLLSILRNLLDNAIEAAADGRTRIAFSARREGDNALFTVTNWGRPIAAASLPHIFDPGFTTKVDYATGQVGRGVGLCLVRDFTEQALGGALTVDARADATSFIVSIPMTSLEVPACDSI